MSPGKALAEHRLVYLFALTLILIGGSYWQSSAAQNRLAAQQGALRAQQITLAKTIAVERQQQLSHCKFDADIGGAPIAVNPATRKPSLLGVTIVSDARVAWHGLGCPGKLAPPSRSFARW